MDRKITQYHGYEVVAAFWQGKYQSQVTHKKKALARFEGSDLDDAFSKALLFAIQEHRKTIPEILYYKNALLQVGFNNGFFTGQVKTGQNILFEEIDFRTEEDAFEQLKKFVDENLETVHEEFLQRHRNYLSSKGVETIGKTAKEHNKTVKRRRTSHCWACYHPVDNQVQHECTTCGWIICTCGTCGCGYRGY